MAKKDADPVPEGEQQDDKKKKKEKGESGPIKTPVLIAIIMGGNIVLAVTVLFALKMFIAPGHSGSQGADSTKTNTEAVEGHGEKDASKAEENEALSDAPTFTISTGRITTNPSGSNSQFVVVSLGLELRTKEKATEEQIKVAKEEKITEVKAGVNQVLWKYTMEDLKRPGVRDSLADEFKEKLKPIFLKANEPKNKMFLREVFIEEFIIQ